MNIVLDTNVFVSGVFFTGPPYRILEAWRDGKLQLVISAEILEEYHRVGEALAERFRSVDVAPIIDLAKTKAKIVQAQNLQGPVCSDPDDDKFLACALGGKCQLIVSGDKHLLKLSGFRGITVMRPRQFVETHLA